MGIHERNIFKKSLFLQWGTSYLVMCFIPLVLLLVFSIVCVSIISKNASETNSLSVQYVAREFDATFGQVNSICEDVLVSSQFQQFNNIDSSKELAPLYLFDTAMALRHMINGDDSIIDCMLYSPSLDLYVTTERWGTLDDLYLRDDFDLGYSQEQVNESFRTRKMVMSIVDASYQLPLGAMNRRIMVIRPISYAKSSNINEMYIAFLIDVSKLFPPILEEYQDMIIANDVSHQIVFDFSNLSISGETVDKVIEMPSGQTLRVNGKIATALDSQVTNFKYISLMNPGVYFKALYLAIGIAIICFVTAVAFGILFAWRRLSRDWNTYEMAMDATGMDINPNVIPENPYVPFVANASKLREEQEGMSLMIRQQTESLKEHMMAKLIERSNEPVSPQALSECGIHLISDKFLVLIVIPKQDVEVQAIETMVLQTIASEEMAIFPFISSYGAAYILNPKYDDASQFLSKFAMNMRTMVMNSMSGIAFAACSSIGTGITSLGNSYLEAINVMEYLRTNGNSEFLFHNDVVAMTSRIGFQYTTEHEMRISQAMEKGDGAQVVQIIDSLVDENRQAGVSPRNLRYLLFGITSTILRTANKLDERYGGVLPEVSFSPILQSDNFERSKSEVSQVVLVLCSAVLQINSQYEVDGKNEFGCYRKALQIIQDKYMDASLNVSQVADDLGVSVSHLSRVFKKYHNQNISEYLTSYRIGMSKQLLSDGVMVTEVATMCGFGSLRTYLRVFKNYERVTPGQFRAMSKENTDA